MSEAKHTPGPWRFHQYTGGPGRGVDPTVPGIIMDGDKTVATVWNLMFGGQYQHTAEQWDANACLIAAAPDLLAACKAVVEEAAGCFHDEADFSGEWKILMAQLRHALAKADRLHAEQPKESP